MKNCMRMMILLLVILPIAACTPTQMRTPPTRSMIEGQLENPPEIHMIYNAVKYPMIRGSTSWHIDYTDGTSMGIQGDSEAPNTLAKTSMFNAPPNSPVTFDIHENCKHILVKCWIDDQSQPIDSSTSTGDIWPLPSQPGQYVYEVIAQYDQGQVHYALRFAIQ